MPLLALSLDRMRALTHKTGLGYDRVMVFPQGRFSRSAMEALRRSDFLAAVNTELVDDPEHRGIRAGELLRPAITSYAGFPLFLRRRATEAIANFALDLLLGKPCLIVTHHDDFRQGMDSLASLVAGLNALDPALQWTNLERIATRTYEVRAHAASNLDVRLFCAATELGPLDNDATISFRKAESSDATDFEIRVAGEDVQGHRGDRDLTFQAQVATGRRLTVEVRRSPVHPVALPIQPTSYRAKVAARRYLSEIRDNYVARSDWATAAVRLIRGSGRRLTKAAR